MGHVKGDSVFQISQSFSYVAGSDLSQYTMELKVRDDVLGIVFRRRKSERLEYWCVPQTPEVLEALAQNFARFLDLLDEHQRGQ